jgi:membrane dipeptidase
VVPEAIDTAAGLQVLFVALGAKGYSETLLGKLGAGNWLDLLQRTIG